MIYLDLLCYSCTSIIRPLRLKQTNSWKTNAPRSIVGTLIVEQKFAFTVEPFIKGCTPPTPRVVQYTQLNRYDSSKGSF